MRTDSVNLSGLAISTAKNEIIEQYGEKYQTRQYLHSKVHRRLTKLRPTYMNEHEVSGTAQEKKL